MALGGGVVRGFRVEEEGGRGRGGVWASAG